MESAEQLRTAIQGFLRGFGALAPDRTPCGQALPISEAHALMWLAAQSDAPTQQVLTAALGIDKSNVARLCARLERAGLLERTVCPADGRVRRLELTPAGDARAAEVDVSSRARFERLLAAIPLDARPAVLDALATLRDAVQAMAGED